MATIQEQIQNIRAGLEQAQGTAQGLSESDMTSSDLLRKTESTLLNQFDPDIVSSQQTGVQEEITSAIDEIRSGSKATQEGIRARFERQRSDVLEQGDVTATTELEARSGFATINAILKNIKTDTEKTLKDLDLREQEALASGRAEEAQTIANLKLQQIQLEQNAKQQAYSNLLNFGNFALSSRQEQRLQEQQNVEKSLTALTFLKDNNLLSTSDPQQKRSLEIDLGLPVGVLDQISGDTELNLRSVDGVGLVNVTRDSSGKPKVDVLVRERQRTPELSVSEQIANRLTVTQQSLNVATGEDGFVSGGSYVNAKNKWVAMGGTLADFKREFPPELYLTSSEQALVPEPLRPEKDIFEELSQMSGTPFTGTDFSNFSN